MLGWSVWLACSEPVGPIEYVARADAEGTEVLTLDTRSPDPAVWGAGPHPVVVLIHAGAWRTGNLYGWGLRGRMEEAAERGFVGVTVEYRLTRDDVDGRVRWPWPAQLQDVWCAVRWVGANAESLGADRTRMAAMGYSAGGHLALMVALDPHRPVIDEACPWTGRPKLAGVVSRAGPADVVGLWDETTNGGRRNLARLHGQFDDRPSDEALRDASPLQAASVGDVPVLQIRGGQDRLVPPDNPARLHEILVDAGVEATLETLDGAGHLFAFSATPRAEELEWAWLEARLEP